MPESDLNILLTQLHKKLNDVQGAQSIDGEAHRMLGIVSQDIAVVLGRHSASSGKNEQASIGSHSLKRMAVEFEAEHPRLAHTLNDVADSLAKIGI
ncbi:MAG: DUF4404 family protein [Gammaproteobacteria bacterium]|nr:DUF4404 family protein [Gammaproteobacteria bacterium]